MDALTVSENIALALAINHVPEDSISGRVAEIAETLQISDILEKYPYQVSGGQKQRCACARAIVSSPRLLLADEPTGALDSHASQVLLETMQDINRRYGATILMVTHDAVSASYAGRTVFLKDGEVYTEIYKGEDSLVYFLTLVVSSTLFFAFLSLTSQYNDILGGDGNYSLALFQDTIRYAVLAVSFIFIVLVRYIYAEATDTKKMEAIKALEKNSDIF